MLCPDPPDGPRAETGGSARAGIEQDLVHALFRNPNEEQKYFCKQVRDRLEVRRRRIHDFRRTFISLARDDGAARDVIRWVTHPPDADILDAYTTPAWSLLCQEIAKLKIRVRDPENAIELPQLAADNGAPTVVDGEGQGLVTSLVTLASDLNEKGLKSCGLEASKDWSGRRDLNPRRPPWQGGTLPLSYSRKLSLNCLERAEFLV